MTQIDLQKCASFVKVMADRLAADGPKSASNGALPDLIKHVQGVSSRAELSLRRQLVEHAPEIGWIGEEDQPTRKDHWLYDPIDGAYHYLQGLPLWSSSLVLVSEGRPVASIVYEPGFGQLFLATEGEGATCNGEKLRVSPRLDARAAVVGAAIPPLAQVGEVEQSNSLALLGSFAKTVFVVRPIAAASLQLAYVAAGRLDAYFELGNDLGDWLAGALLITEAAGTVTDLDGAALDWSGRGILAGNSTIHATLLKSTSQR